MFASYLTLLAVFGCTISGIWLLYMTVMTIFLSPGVYIYVLPEYMKTCVKRYLYKYIDEPKLLDDVDEDEEYVPEFSEEKLFEAYASEFYSEDGSDDFLAIDRDDIPNVDHLPSFDDGLDELDRLSDVAKMSLEFSETSSTASDISSLERVRLRGENFEVASEFDETSDYEDEAAFLPDPQYRRKESESSALGALVSSLTFPDLNLMSGNVFMNMLASVSTSQSQPQKTVPTQCDPNTDDEFEFINESDLN